jgi:hypothetical protein
MQTLRHMLNERRLEANWDMDHAVVALGYRPLVQWRLIGRRGRAGMNLIRSLMLLWMYRRGKLGIVQIRVIAPANDDTIKSASEPE